MWAHINCQVRTTVCLDLLQHATVDLLNYRGRCQPAPDDRLVSNEDEWRLDAGKLCQGFKGAGHEVEFTPGLHMVRAEHIQHAIAVAEDSRPKQTFNGCVLIDQAPAHSDRNRMAEHGMGILNRLDASARHANGLIDPPSQ